MKRRIIPALFLLGMLSLTSCATKQIGNVSLITVRPLKMDGTDNCYVDNERQVVGQISMRKSFFYWDLSWCRKGGYKAVQKAIEAEGPECMGLANATITWEGSTLDGILGYFFKSKYTATGNPVYRR